MTSGVALLIRLSLTLETSLELFVCSPGAQVSIVNVFFPRPLIQISMINNVQNVMFYREPLRDEQAGLLIENYLLKHILNGS